MDNETPIDELNLSAYKHYLLDLGYLLKEMALEAKEQRESSRGTQGEEFYAGQQFAYYAVISTMKNQAMAFQIPLKDLRLEDIQPDADLLG